MSNKSKYIGVTALFSTAAFLAFFTAYRFFGSTPRIVAGDAVNEIGAETEITDYRENDVPEDKTEDEAVEKPEAAEAVSIADRINEDTIIVYEYHYEEGNKTERASQKAPNALLNLTRSQLAARIEGFSVVSFSPKEVVLRKKISRSKSDKYILGIWEGRIAVFYSGSGLNQSGLKEVTDTPVASLSQDEQERLMHGIIIEGDAELMKVLEDYGS